jgi:hypothetical protein
LAIAAALVASGVAIHYVAWVHYLYPMVGSEDYLTPLMWFGVLLSMLNWLPCGAANSLDKAHEAHPNFDLELWGAALIWMFALGWMAKAQTDVGGMDDPWETVTFPDFLRSGFGSVGLFIVACAVVAGGFAGATRLIQSSGSWFAKIWGTMLIFGLALVGECLVALAFQLWLEPPPLLPISTDVCLLSIETWHFDIDDGYALLRERTIPVAAILNTRILVFGASVWLWGWLARPKE